jgi:hypothetical protein
VLDKSCEEVEGSSAVFDAEGLEDATFVGVVPGDVAREDESESASSLTCWRPRESFDGWFCTEEVDEDRALVPALVQYCMSGLFV